MAINKGNLSVVKVGTATAPTQVLEHINTVALTMDSKNIDVTEFAAAAPAYIARAAAIKDVKATMSGFLEKGATGQAIVFANFVSDTALFVKILLTATVPAVEFSAVVDSIEMKPTIDGFVEVTFSVSGAGAVVIT